MPRQEVPARALVAEANKSRRAKQVVRAGHAGVPDMAHDCTIEFFTRLGQMHGQDNAYRGEFFPTSRSGLVRFATAALREHLPYVKTQGRLGAC